MNKYKQHIHDLCRYHNITIVYDKKDWFYNNADPFLRWIYIAPIKGKELVPPYAAALHEIGHVINKDNNNKLARAFKNKKTTRCILTYEINAWRTARKISKYWNDQMTRFMCYAISRYIFYYNCDHPTRPLSDVEHLNALGIKI